MGRSQGVCAAILYYESRKCKLLCAVERWLRVRSPTAALKFILSPHLLVFDTLKVQCDSRYSRSPTGISHERPLRTRRPPALPVLLDAVHREPGLQAEPAPLRVGQGDVLRDARRAPGARRDGGAVVRECPPPSRSHRRCGREPD